METLLQAVFSKRGALDEGARQAAAAGDPATPYCAYALKVRDASYKVMDEDIQQMKTAGLSEEQIFEITVSAAIGGSRERLQAAQRAVQGGP